MSTNNFLPEGYETPNSSANYLKFEDGENKFRILGQPILGWIDWKDKKPMRFPLASKPSAPIDPAKAIKHFWAMPVWDYKGKKIAILEITQKSIQSEITILSKDDDWGNPLDYDIKVTRKGTGMETEYTVNPVPHKPLHEKIVELLKETPINLQALFEGKDPFDTGSKVETYTAPVYSGADDDDQLPF